MKIKGKFLLNPMRIIVNLKKMMMKNLIIKIDMVAKAANLLIVEKVALENHQDNQSLKISQGNNRIKLLKTQKLTKILKILIYDNQV